MGTSDYGEAVQKALEIRQTPELAPAAVFVHEIDAFIAHKIACNEYNKRSAGVKVHALKNSPRPPAGQTPPPSPRRM